MLGFRKGGNEHDSQEQIFNNITVLGLVGIKDPIRDGIYDAVQLCHQAGVKVRMITGDNEQTAVAIAK